MTTDRFFGILGGMGTLASEAFIQAVNKKTDAGSDQEYLNYILMNHATVPDRTEYILGRSSENPLTYLLEDISRFNKLNVEFIVITCNTAHFFHEELQKHSDAEIVHMPRITVEEIRKQVPLEKKVAFLGTEGSIKASIYKDPLVKSGCDIYYPGDKLQAKVNKLIYEEVKEKGNLNLSLYNEIINEVRSEGELEAIILGCTELSWIYETDESVRNDKMVFDAQAILVDHVIARTRR